MGFFALGFWLFVVTAAAVIAHTLTFRFWSACIGVTVFAATLVPVMRSLFGYFRLDVELVGASAVTGAVGFGVAAIIGSPSLLRERSLQFCMDLLSAVITVCALLYAASLVIPQILFIVVPVSVLVPTIGLMTYIDRISGLTGFIRFVLTMILWILTIMLCCFGELYVLSS